MLNKTLPHRKHLYLSYLSLMPRCRHSVSNSLPLVVALKYRGLSLFPHAILL